MTDDSRSPHPDSAPDELDLLASRVLDGDVDPTERARAEADPEVASRIAAMARTRAELRELPPLDPTVTARAVAAALGVFDEQHGALTTTVTSHDAAPLAPVVPLRRRWSTALPWLGAAAAAAALVVGVASIGNRSGDDLADSRPADSAARTQDDAAGQDESAPEAASAPESTDGDVTTMSAEDGVAEPSNADDAPVEDTGRIGDDSADTAAPMSGTEAPAATSAPSDQEMTVAGAGVVLDDDAALGSFAESATPAEGASVCAADATLLTSDAVFGDDPTTAVIVEVVRDAAGDVVAYDLATCSEAARVPAG